MTRQPGEASMSTGPSINEAKAFWWATILRAGAAATGHPRPKISEVIRVSMDAEEREASLTEIEGKFRSKEKILLFFYAAQPKKIRGGRGGVAQAAAPVKVFFVKVTPPLSREPTPAMNDPMLPLPG